MQATTSGVDISSLEQQDAERRVARCVAMLEDDYHRQSQYLHVDDVHRLTSRLGPEASLSVWDSLVAKSIPITGLKEDPNGTSVKTDDDRFTSDEAWPSAYDTHELLTHEQEIQLGRRVRAGSVAQDAGFSVLACEELQHIIGSGESAKAKLILSNVRLVIHCAKKHTSRTTLPLEDLVQEGILGLFRAADKYDPERGFKFSTYATWWVNQCIQRAIETTGRTVRVPSHMFARLRDLRRKRKQLKSKLRRRPSTVELARELGWDLSDVSLLLQIERDTKSLDQPTSGESGDNGLARRMPSRTESPVVAAERKELRRIVAKVLSTLDERARHILILRFGLNGKKPRTLEQVGKKFGVTRERIRQIEKRALEKISGGSRGAILREYADVEEEMEAVEADE